jgi:RND family efflux transporter MFP subunit
MKPMIKMTAVLLSFIALAGCKDEIPQKETIRPVRAMQVPDPSEFIGRWFPGQAKATQEVDLSFRVAGPLVTLPVNVGDEVRKGQDLARIDPRDYEVSLRDARGQLSKSRAEFERAEADYERVIRIRKQDPGAVSQALVDRNRQQMESTRAEIRSQQAVVDAANDQLGYTFLKAPFDGIITATYVENFEDVKAKQPIVRLIDHSQIEMIVGLPESLITFADSMRANGKLLLVQFDQFADREFQAQIKEIGKEASKTTRTYPITLIMDQPGDIKILPGMAGKARPEAMVEKKGAVIDIVVPETAVFSPEEGNQTYVWVIEESSKQVNQRAVKTGELLQTGISIKEGLKPGEWVATAGVHYLKEGQLVRILSQTSKEVTQ